MKETLLNKLENEEIEKVVKLTAELVVEARRSNEIEEMEDE